jgi:alanine dehydrogenase
MTDKFYLGFPRMHKEPGERRDFLPSFIARLHKLGAEIVLEYGYGAEMGFKERDYRSIASTIRFASRTEVYQQNYVLVLRCPTDDELRLLHPGACLISMLHYPTRPKRVAFLHSLGIEAISLDSIKDDSGRRLVENLRAVGWNGVEIAFRTLAMIYPQPGLESPSRPPIQVTLLGAGAVGSHVMQAAVNYGNRSFRNKMVAANVPGVQVIAVDFDLTSRETFMRSLLQHTDILVDATQRVDASIPVIPNAWIAEMPQHAVLLDLSVDPYDCSDQIITVKGIEGIPHGNLDKYVFPPDDPAYNEIPLCIDRTHRRYAVSCYSWPGIYPKECMEGYGKQIQPLLRNLIERGGVSEIRQDGHFFERAIHRSLLSHYLSDSPERSSS